MTTQRSETSQFAKFAGGSPVDPSLLADTLNALESNYLPSSQRLYVDGTNGSDSNSGADWSNAFATIAAAVAAADETGTHIYVAPGAYTETVETDAYGTAPGYCSIIGVPGNRLHPHVPSWSSSGSGSECLIINVNGWEVRGFKFMAPEDAFSIKARCLYDSDDASDGSSSNTAIRTVIRGNTFYGGPTVDTLGGIVFYGAGYEDVVDANHFSFLGVPAGDGGDDDVRAIKVAGTDYALPYRCQYTNNIFLECDGFFDFLTAGTNSCIFRGNVLQGGSKAGYSNSPKLVLAGGEDNLIVENILGGTYADGSDYAGTTGDQWLGNAASTGFTSAAPA